jgi:serine/threonine protein kinase
MLGGICPECMLKAGLATQTEGPGGAGPHGTKVVQPPPLPAEIAALFPQLEILECLGRGGMGVVYKARQPRLNRFVALKILAREKEQDVQFAERFAREAQALARLNHPNIVTVYDFGTVGQASSLSPSEKAQAGSETGATPVLHYLLMEFVDGLNLRQLLQTGRMPSAQALTIVPKICEALQYAHTEGIVHRDIKPENILLDKSGRVKIADFGIAKMMGEETGQQTLTGAREAVGTPHYMAPEQIEKPLTVDHRADIYSLGVVFYEMLTGELPLGKFQPPSAKVQIDVRLDEVVLHALEKEPDRRYQQASVLKTEVETIVAGTPRLENQSSKAENKPRLSDAAVVGACLAPFFFISMFFWDFGHLGGLPALRGLIISSLGFIAIIGTTILGWVATGQIRRSEGRRCGMWLAVSDGLLFPVLVLDVVLLLGLLLANKCLNIWLLTRWYPVLAEHAFLNNPHFLIWLAITTAVVIWIDYTIIRRIWRTVNKLTNQPSRPVCFNHAWRFAAVVFVIILSYQLSRTVFSHLIAGRSHPVKSDYIGQAWFPQGDSIEITSVERTPERVSVKGHYNLVSHHQASLALYITSTNQPGFPEGAKQTMSISEGRGSFELVHPHIVPGLPHLSMFADGKPFAALYFGTQAEALEESNASWITDALPVSSESAPPTRRQASAALEDTNANRPKVIFVSPADGATNVDAEQEISIRFDQPMNPNDLALQWIRGGFQPDGQPRYDSDQNEFVIPAWLASGRTNELAVNFGSGAFGGFRGTNPALAQTYRWQFNTRPLATKPGAGQPKVVRNSPTPGETLPVLTMLKITFDRPMMSPGQSPPYLRIVGWGGWGLPALIPSFDYDPASRTFTVPVLLPPDNETRLTLEGFKSADGMASEPMVISCQVGTNNYSSEQLDRIVSAAKDPRLEELLSSMKTARSQLTSGVEMVQSLSLFGQTESLDNEILSHWATFKWQGTNQVCADLSDVMGMTKAFILGTDGKTCWLYSEDNHNQRRLDSAPVPR